MKPIFMMLLAIGVLFYFLILRPQKTEQRKRDAMLQAMGKGDKVISSGGIHGTIESVDADEGIITLNVAPKIAIKFSRSAIATVVQKKNQKESDAGEAKG